MKRTDFGFADSSSSPLLIHYLVLAGNAFQADTWAKENGIPRSHFTYIYSPHQLLGISSENYGFISCGEYWKNPLYRSSHLTALLNRFIAHRKVQHRQSKASFCPVNKLLTVRMIRV